MFQCFTQSNSYEGVDTSYISTPMQCSVLDTYSKWLKCPLHHQHKTSVRKLSCKGFEVYEFIYTPLHNSFTTMLKCIHTRACMYMCVSLWTCHLSKIANCIFPGDCLGYVNLELVRIVFNASD